MGTAGNQVADIYDFFSDDESDGDEYEEDSAASSTSSKSSRDGRSPGNGPIDLDHDGSSTDIGEEFEDGGEEDYPNDNTGKSASNNIIVGDQDVDQAENDEPEYDDSEVVNAIYDSTEANDATNVDSMPALKARKAHGKRCGKICGVDYIEGTSLEASRQIWWKVKWQGEDELEDSNYEAWIFKKHVPKGNYLLQMMKAWAYRYGFNYRAENDWKIMERGTYEDLHEICEGFSNMANLRIKMQRKIQRKKKEARKKNVIKKKKKQVEKAVPELPHGLRPLPRRVERKRTTAKGGRGNGQRIRVLKK